MNKQQTLEALKNIAAQLADDFSLDLMTTKDTSVRFDDWNMYTNNPPLCDFIKEELKKLGETYQDIHFTFNSYEKYDIHKDMIVTLSNQSGTPKIDVGMLDGHDGYVSATFIDKAPEGEPENYKLGSAQISEEKGKAYLDKIMTYWQEEKEKVLDRETPALSIKDMFYVETLNNKDISYINEAGNDNYFGETKSDFEMYDITVNKEFPAVLLKQFCEEYACKNRESGTDKLSLAVSVEDGHFILYHYENNGFDRDIKLNLTKNQEEAVRKAIIDYAVKHNIIIQGLKETLQNTNKGKESYKDER